MATTSNDAEAMIRCARERGVRLQIGTVRRYYWCNRQMKHLLASGELGRVVGVQVEEGTPHDWPTASGFFFDRKQSGGGVLIDWGAHSLDLVLWWLQDYPAAIECRHDCFGGVESECELDLQFGSGEQGSIRLSRLRNLSNTYTLRFERGTASYQMYDTSWD
jgi:predicted dehydrogenase